MSERYWSDTGAGTWARYDFVGFSRYAGFPYYFVTPKRTTAIGGLETYLQLHALYTGALPSEVL